MPTKNNQKTICDITVKKSNDVTYLNCDSNICEDIESTNINNKLENSQAQTHNNFFDIKNNAFINRCINMDDYKTLEELFNIKIKIIKNFDRNFNIEQNICSLCGNSEKNCQLSCDHFLCLKCTIHNCVKFDSNICMVCNKIISKTLHVIDTNDYRYNYNEYNCMYV